MKSSLTQTQKVLIQALKPTNTLRAQFTLSKSARFEDVKNVGISVMVTSILLLSPKRQLSLFKICCCQSNSGQKKPDARRVSCHKNL